MTDNRQADSHTGQTGKQEGEQTSRNTDLAEIQVNRQQTSRKEVRQAVRHTEFTVFVQLCVLHAVQL